MKILVTGGAGFIGSNLVEKLLDFGNEVVVLDNFSTGKKENLLPFADHPRFTLIEGDIRVADDCRRAVRGCEVIFHEAARGSVPFSIANPVETLEVNVLGFAQVLNASREAGVRRVIYASSSSVYGDDPTLPKIEARIGAALSPYALSKQSDELIAQNFAQVYHMDIIGLRYFNVFGRRQDPDSPYAAVIPRFIQALLGHQSPTIYGDGSASRDFTHVDNVVSANLLALNCPLPEAETPIFNIAAGGNISVAKLFEELKAALAKFDAAIGNIECRYAPSRSGDIPHSCADITKARRLLGYKVERDFASGIAETVEFYLKKR